MRFDPERGFRLATYAMWWIRAAIQEYILHSWSLVKMGTTAAQKKLFFNLRKLKGQMQAIEDGDLTPEHVSDIATRLGVAETEVVQMNRRISSPDASLNAPLREEGEGEWQDWLVDQDDDQEIRLAGAEETHGRRRLLAGALDTLSDRERQILAERRLRDHPATLEHLSQRYGISRERVRQIEVRAFEKVQRSVRTAAVEHRLAMFDGASASQAQTPTGNAASSADSSKRGAVAPASPSGSASPVKMLRNPGVGTGGGTVSQVSCQGDAPIGQALGGCVQGAIRRGTTTRTALSPSVRRNAHTLPAIGPSASTGL
jgi:RNA polymerase sigma-32 factor